MSSFGERVNGIHIRVKAPGAEIFAELRNRSEVTIFFGSGVYDWLAERHLERYLGGLARLLYVAWTREYQAALNESYLRDTGGPQTQADRDYLAARGRLVATGSSHDGRVAVTARGMQEVTVRVADGTVRALTEHQFADRTREAATALAQDHLGKIRELKLHIYG